MANLVHASHELFRRPADERFESLADICRHCLHIKEQSRRIKEPGCELRPMLDDGQLALKINGHPSYRLNDWSFSQLCSLAGVGRDTLNRLQPETAVKVFDETLRQRTDDETEYQALVFDNTFIRSINGERYKRLWNADLVAMLMEFATDFTPPQKGFNGATGLYAGDQDMFCFMIDPAGWTEIGGEAFAPGFFIWNSEVGRRTVGVSTFWFQAVCQNHIVWDAVNVVEFTRKHTGKVCNSLSEIRAAIETLVAKRDERKDGFARVVTKAMETTYGDDAEGVQKLLAKAGFTRQMAKLASELAQEQGRFTIWSVVDALTRIARDETKYAGSRNEIDQQAASLLALASV
jgi:hypothetical protein